MNISEYIWTFGVMFLVAGFSFLAAIQIKLTIGKSYKEALSTIIWKELIGTEKKIANWGLRSLALGILCLIVGAFIS